ncbi:MAG: hypothetical protein JNM56_31935 [Planctomycetia bacterium]|nr:hypothetical protein [Planctomycetia bacterium]
MNPKNGELPDCFGFRSGARGTHSSRTIMLAELRLLLASRPATASKAAYRSAIIEDNVLGKKTVTTRRLTAKRMGELYALDPQVTVFRLLRHFWDLDQEGRPLLAFLCSSARDPLLRLTAEPIFQANEGDVVPKESLEKAIDEAAPNRFNPAIAQAIARRASSSWTQSGHLTGHVIKKRSRPAVTPANAAYALVLGYLTGARGQMLLNTVWTQLLDVPIERVAALAAEASRRGWLNYRQVGKVIDIQFPDLLTAAEKEMLRGQD